ncbi:MAG: cell division protein ZapA [Bacteroidetes bacterium]|nr:cell division protein ZapA [Bacteroidota bacterium]
MENQEQDEKIIIEPIIAGKKFPLRIEKEKEEAHRRGSELLNQLYEMYEKQNEAGLSRADIMSMAAYSLAVQVIDLQQFLIPLIGNDKK